MSSKPTQSDARAWGDFWASNASGGNGGCLPQRWAIIEDAQKAAWQGFVRDLPETAHVLDLATGDGRVPGWMRALRSDLILTGIDRAPTLPPAPVGVQTLSGVSMEDLPFEVQSFDAVTSQFGFEYGDVKAVTKQIARVLSDQGVVGLMVHRGDGPILAHNKTRQRELLWALRDKGTAKKAKGMLAKGPTGIAKAAKLAEKTAAMGAEKFGQNSPAWEIPEAIHRSVTMGARAGPQSIIETITAIEDQARNELGRIASLARACKTADQRDALHAAFESHSLQHKDTQPISVAGDGTLADFITFKR